MNRTFGSIHWKRGDALHPNRFLITAEPHVMIRLKAVLGRVNKNQFGTVSIAETPEVCRDLDWFMERYPLAMEEEAEKRIRKGSRQYQKTLVELEEILLPEAPRRLFNLALPLRPYQAQAVELYLKAKSLLLADQMGLGKTVTALGSFTETGTLPALVVCQTHLTRQWQEFLQRFLPGMESHIIKAAKPYKLPPAQVYITTYHKLSGWADVWNKRFFKSIVFDEIQELRHQGTGKHQAASAIREKVDYCLALSGTPIFNYGGEIFSVLQIVKPGCLGTETEFHREWCDTVSGKNLLRDPKACGTWMKEQFLMLRRSREDVGMELPAAQKIVQTIPYDPHILDQIKNHALELAHLILTGEFTQRGQAAREFDTLLRQQTGIAKAPFVAEFVRLLAEEGQRLLLFGWHRAVYDIWLERLKDFHPVLFTGSESPAQKEAAKQAFIKGESNIMIMSLRAGSGVDGLQSVCNTGVFGEMDWSPGVHEQCAARLDRDGVNRGLSFFYLLADGGSDPPMAEVLGLKRSQVQGILQTKENEPELIGTDADRLKKLAEEFLKRHGKEIYPAEPATAAQQMLDLPTAINQ